MSVLTSAYVCECVNVCMFIYVCMYIDELPTDQSRFTITRIIYNVKSETKYSEM